MLAEVEGRLSISSSLEGDCGGISWYEESDMLTVGVRLIMY